MASRTVSRITLKWLALVVRGLAATVIGIAAFVWPGITVPGLVLLFGAYALAHGVLSLVQAFGRETEDRWLTVLEGLIGITVGIAAFVWPEITGQALLQVIAEVQEESSALTDSQLEAAGGRVFRRAATFTVNEQIGRNVSAIRGDIARLDAEYERAKGEAKARLRARIDAAKAKLPKARDRARE